MYLLSELCQEKNVKPLTQLEKGYNSVIKAPLPPSCLHPRYVPIGQGGGRGVAEPITMIVCSAKTQFSPVKTPATGLLSAN